MRCGDVYRAERWPAARRAASTIAVTDPLPLVPAMCTDRNARSGCPSAATIALMLSSPNLMPNCSRPNSQVSESVNPSWQGGLPSCGRRRAAHESQRVGDDGLHLAAIDYQVQHVFREQELRALKPLGELLANGLLDDPRAGEPDEGLRFADV